LKRGRSKEFQPNLIGIGVDCEEISRFKMFVDNKSVVMKVLSNQEIRLFQKKGGKRLEFLAGRFVAKESIIKALSSVVPRLDMRDISILRGKDGSPRVLLSRRVSSRKALLISISISHCNSMAVAFCVAHKIKSISNDKH
jgi:holo-[acyl-carrier protein] synthase